jgi:hypothetical protein
MIIVRPRARGTSRRSWERPNGQALARSGHTCTHCVCAVPREATHCGVSATKWRWPARLPQDAPDSPLESRTGRARRRRFTPGTTRRRPDRSPSKLTPNFGRWPGQTAQRASTTTWLARRERPLRRAARSCSAGERRGGGTPGWAAVTNLLTDYDALARRVARACPYPASTGSRWAAGVRGTRRGVRAGVRV